MTDVLTPAQRHKNMCRIHDKDTKPEIIVRKYLFAHGFRYRLNVNSLPGKPDIVLPKYRTVIFVNGCFWHGHQGCRYFVIPKTRTEWWTQKIEKNRARDRQEQKELESEGWHTIVVWECQLKPVKRQETLENLIHALGKIYVSNKKEFAHA